VTDLFVAATEDDSNPETFLPFSSVFPLQEKVAILLASHSTNIRGSGATWIICNNQHLLQYSLVFEGHHIKENGIKKFGFLVGPLVYNNLAISYVLILHPIKEQQILRLHMS
jgi:hypothetical protein